MTDRTYQIGETELREMLDAALAANAHHTCIVGPLCGPMQSEPAVLLVYSSKVADALLTFLSERAQAAPGCEGGVTVRWCPRCGTCTCPSQDGNPDRWEEDPLCPIHGHAAIHSGDTQASAQPAPVKYGDKEWLMAAVADEAAAGDPDQTTAGARGVRD